MADILKTNQDGVTVRYVDQGDGTYAEYVATAGGGGGGSGSGERLAVEPLGIPGVARQVTTTTASANTVLTVGVGRISIFARTAPLRYVVGSSAQTASASTSHYLAAGERIDIDVPATPNIAVIRASDATADGAAEITELS